MNNVEDHVYSPRRAYDSIEPTKRNRKTFKTQQQQRMNRIFSKAGSVSSRSPFIGRLCSVSSSLETGCCFVELLCSCLVVRVQEQVKNTIHTIQFSISVPSSECRVSPPSRFLLRRTQSQQNQRKKPTQTDVPSARSVQLQFSQTQQLNKRNTEE